MYAIIATGGKQYRVSAGDVIQVERLAAEPDDKVVFDQVLAVGAGTDLKVGRPRVEGVQVHGQVLEHGRHHKIDVMFYRRKKRWRRRRGHRQQFTRVRIDKVEA